MIADSLCCLLSAKCPRWLMPAPTLVAELAPPVQEHALHLLNQQRGLSPAAPASAPPLAHTAGDMILQQVLHAHAAHEAQYLRTERTWQGYQTAAADFSAFLHGWATPGRHAFPWTFEAARAAARQLATTCCTSFACHTDEAAEQCTFKRFIAVQHSVHTRAALGVSTSIATPRVADKHKRTVSLTRCPHTAAKLRIFFYGSSRRRLETVSASVDLCETLHGLKGACMYPIEANV